MTATTLSMVFYLLLAVLIIQSQSILETETIRSDFFDFIGRDGLIRDRDGDEDPNLRSAQVYTTIKNGTLRGFTARAANNNTIYSFMKIPFAKPPIDDLRFKNPEPAEGWGDEIYDATQLIPSCPQFLTGLVPPHEDCLYLNVYSSRSGNETGRPPAPVMVFFYGGGYFFGESSYYTGHRLLANDVVLVVPNYRLNILGFFSTGDDVALGNFGLKDQNWALRWVQENIAAFGGDPNQVTIFGESAGAGSVIYHLISPKSHGLFSKVIAQSGSANAPWSLDEDPLKSAQRFSGSIGCPNTTSQEMVDCLRTKPTINITRPFVEQLAGDIVSDMSLRFWGTMPVIEPDVPGAFITKHPAKLLRTGVIPDVPVIFGCNADEASLAVGGFYVLNFGLPAIINSTVYNPKWMREDLIYQLMANTYGLETRSGSVAIEESVALAFMPNKNRLNFTTITDGLANMMSVFAIKGPVLKTANILSDRLTSVYFYSFEHQSSDRKNSLGYYLSDLLAAIVGGGKPPVDHGVMHADELIYEFNLPFILTDEDKAFSKMFCELWVNFATHGTPTPESTEYYPLWPKYHWKNPQYYVLNATPAVELDYTKQWTS